MSRVVRLHAHECPTVRPHTSAVLFLRGWVVVMLSALCRASSSSCVCKRVTILACPCAWRGPRQLQKRLQHARSHQLGKQKVTRPGSGPVRAETAAGTVQCHFCVLSQKNFFQPSQQLLHVSNLTWAWPRHVQPQPVSDQEEWAVLFHAGQDRATGVQTTWSVLFLLGCVFASCLALG